MTSAGQKVTNDPRSQDRIPEAAGIITSDSLAAESVNAGGSFGAGNPKAGVSKQPSSSTTTNTTDTSNARKLDPAVDSEAREAQQQWAQHGSAQGAWQANTQQLNQVQGVGPTYNTSGTPTMSATGGVPGTGSTGGNAVPSGNTAGHTTANPAGNAGGAGTGHAAPAAPTGGYAGSAIPPESQKPKGANLTEGGFEGAGANTTKGAEIGTEDDPGRVAENVMKKSGGDTLSNAGTANPRQAGLDSNTPYDALKSEQNA